jgi:hypothetical protein
LVTCFLACIFHSFALTNRYIHSRLSIKHWNSLLLSGCMWLACYRLQNIVLLLEVNYLTSLSSNGHVLQYK